jgi:hypothetical protein
MKKTSALGARLEEKFGAKHFIADQARKVKVKPALVATLNRLVDQPQRREKGVGVREDMFGQGKNATKRLTVQKVIVAPENTLFFAHSRAGRLVTESQLSAFGPMVPDKEAFRRQLLEETKKLEDIFQDEPMLAWDFQALVDTEGNLYHIDLDGHLSHIVIGTFRRTIRKRRESIVWIFSEKCRKSSDDCIDHSGEPSFEDKNLEPSSILDKLTSS